MRHSSRKINRLLVVLMIQIFLNGFGYINANAQLASINDSAMHLADPTIYYHDRIYYLYGTVEGNTGRGFRYYTSTDLWKWQTGNASAEEYALKKGATFGTDKFWAPQVFKTVNQFHMAYTANENIAIATAATPAGPFEQQEKGPLAAAARQIDPFVFIDDDGKKYLYHVRLLQGNKIFVAEMEDDLSAIKPGSLKECITAAEPWENTAHSDWPVAEGPTVVKHKNVYYLLYSANDFRNPDYAVGYATSTSPSGPWKKYKGNPIISKKNTGWNGTGHGDLMIDNRQQLQYVLHTHFSETVAIPRRTAIIEMQFIQDDREDMDKIVADIKSFRFLAVSK